METIEYRVKSAIRYFVTRYHSGDNGGGVGTFGEYSNVDMANKVGELMAKAEGGRFTSCFKGRMKSQRALSRGDKPVVYQCGCGSVDFKLMKTGVVQCSGCDDYYTDIEVCIPEGVPEPA